MYVCGFEGSWFDHPFLRSRFLITTEEQLSRVVTSRVAAVLIDDQAGIGPPPAPGGSEDSASNALTSGPVAPRTPPAQSRHARVRETPQRTPLSPRERAREMRKATRTLEKGRKAVNGLFEDARLGKAVRTDRLTGLVEQITQSVDTDPGLILNVARLKTKDEYTFLHSVAVCALMINFGRTIGIAEDRIPALGIAGMLHDIGKMGVPDTILKKAGALDDAEYATIRTHPEIGHAILEKSRNVPPLALDICLHHHERMDGKGYPHRLPGDALSLETRMSALCDVYDAVTSQRPYNEPWSPADALARMASWAGHFDRLLLERFIESLNILPTGSLVRMADDHLAIVTGSFAEDHTVPLLRSFYSLERGKPAPYRDRQADDGPDLANRIVSVEQPDDHGFADWRSLSAAVMAGEPLDPLLR